MSAPKNILVTRTDRLGDVLLTLPTLTYLRQCLPQTKIDFLCRKSMIEVIGPYLSSLSIHPIADHTMEPEHLMSQGYQAALFLFCDSHLLRKAWKKRIPWRVGLYSKPWSFLTLNAGQRQRRSKARINEAQYNLALAQVLVHKLTGEKVPLPPFSIELPKQEDKAQQARKILSEIKIEAEKPFILIHPGMGGSALNLAPQSYLEVIRLLRQKTGWPIAITVGPHTTDQSIAQAIQEYEQSLPLLSGFSLTVFMELLRFASLVVGPSTGPLHLAHYVGTQTMGFFPPVRTQHPLRWAPWGGKGYSQTFTPDVLCPTKRNCQREQCQHYSCMDHPPWLKWVIGSTKV